MNETLDFPSLMPSLPFPVYSLGDAILAGVILAFAFYAILLIVKALGFLLEGFAENYDFKSHMLLFIAMMVTYIAVKIV